MGNKYSITRTINEADEKTYKIIGITIFVVLVIINFLLAVDNDWNFYYLIELLKLRSDSERIY